MKVIIENDFRGLIKGSEYEFKFKDNLIESMCIVGKNGCGKSSLMNAITGKFTKNTGMYGSIVDNNRISLSKNISIIDHEFDACFGFDASKEGSATIDTSYDASSYVENGGFYADKQSHGEGEMTYLGTFLDRIKPNIIPNKTLICLDEFDKGFSLKNQLLAINLVNRFVMELKCKVLYCTHNPFLMIQSYFVYDFIKKEYVESTDYILDVTGFLIQKPK